VCECLNSSLALTLALLSSPARPRINQKLSHFVHTESFLCFSCVQYHSRRRYHALKILICVIIYSFSLIQRFFFVLSQGLLFIWRDCEPSRGRKCRKVPNSQGDFEEIKRTLNVSCRFSPLGLFQLPRPPSQQKQQEAKSRLHRINGRTRSGVCRAMDVKKNGKSFPSTSEFVSLLISHSFCAT
jgi:hypothetical protein